MTKIDVHFAALISTYLLQGTAAEDIGCFVTGECTHSPYENGWPVVDKQDCLDKCQGFDGCEYFTYYGEVDYCVGFSACFDLNPSSCQDCYSGESTCTDMQCWVKGRCSGIFLTVDYVNSESTCLMTCQSEDSCNWFTFNDADGSCTLFEGCYDISTDICSTCWTGQKACGERRDFTKILIVGGYNDNTEEYLDDVEVIDLTSEVQNCALPAKYPFPVSYMVGALFYDMPLICGGMDATQTSPRLYTDKCYQYRHSDNLWIATNDTMVIGRFGHKASIVDSKTLLISGGDVEPQDVLDSTDVLQNDVFNYGPFLPAARRYHCQVTLNATHVAVLAGYNGLVYFRDFYLLDWENQYWIKMPDLHR